MKNEGSTPNGKGRRLVPKKSKKIHTTEVPYQELDKQISKYQNKYMSDANSIQ